MKHLGLSLALAIAFAASFCAKAQTNIQALYDFGSDRQHLTLTVEGYYADKWGDTFFFIDHDLNYVSNKALTYSPGGSYLEIARNLNFWQDYAIAPLSLHVEYNGGLTNSMSFQNAFLAGVDYSVFPAGKKMSLHLLALYKYIDYSDGKSFSKVPMQFTATWGFYDLFGVKGLEFSGFADFWWEDQQLLYDYFGEMLPEKGSTVFVSEPQIWYNLGRFFSCDNLKIGGEVELSYNFGAKKGFWCRPAAGLKWVF